MKRKDLIGLHCSSEYHMCVSGIVKDLFKDENNKWKVVIEDTNYDTTITINIDNVVFDYSKINKWSFEYYYSYYEIDGDEKFFKGVLWLDAKISEDEVVKIISLLYSGENYFTLRNLKVIDCQTKELKFKNK